MPTRRCAVTDFDWKSPNYEAIAQERIRRLEKIRSTPGMLEGLKAYYKDNPVAFISDWGMTVDPRNADVGIPVKVPFVLFPKQAEFIEWLVARWRGREDGVCEKSRDMGVSWLCVAAAVWVVLFHPGAVFGFGSRKEEYVDRIGDPKSLFWKIREFINSLPPEFRPAGWDAAKHAPFMRVVNPENGAAIVGEAGDNIGRGNRAAIYVVDESAFLEHPESIDAALSQTANCKIHVSTPNGVGNPFYRKRHSGKYPVFVFDWRDDPRKDEAWYKAQCEKHEPHVVAQEIDRNYEASITDAFINGRVVTEAMLRGPAQVQAVGRLRVGVDPARFGDDKFAVTIRKGRLLLLQEETQYLDSIQGAAYVKRLLEPFGERPEQIAVDEIGIGAGVVDQLKGWFGNIVVGINSSIRMDGDDSKPMIDAAGAVTQCYNMRAFMWSEMREWLKSCSLPNDPELKAELCSVRYLYRGGSLLLESKDDMKKRGVKSPNKADSLALTFADPRAPEDYMANDVFSDPRFTQGRRPATRAGY